MFYVFIRPTDDDRRTIWFLSNKLHKQKLPTESNHNNKWNCSANLMLILIFKYDYHFSVGNKEKKKKKKKMKDSYLIIGF